MNKPIESQDGKEKPPSICPTCGGRITTTGRVGHEKTDCLKGCYGNRFKPVSGKIGFGNID